MTCEDTRDLHAYVDGELDLVGSLEVEAHLGGCAECASEQANLRALRTAFGNGALYYEAPARLERRVHAAVRDARAEQNMGAALRLRASAGEEPRRLLSFSSRLSLEACYRSARRRAL